MRTVQRHREHLWPRPEDEHAWRALPPGEASIYAPLAQRADRLLEAAEEREPPEGPGDDALPDEVRDALHELGYLQ